MPQKKGGKGSKRLPQQGNRINGSRLRRTGSTVKKPVKIPARPDFGADVVRTFGDKLRRWLPFVSEARAWAVILALVFSGHY